MKVAQLVEWFGLEIRAGAAGQEREVRGGYCGDLLSDVMANAPSGSIWLTVQGHLNIVAVALLREMAAVVLTGGPRPGPGNRPACRTGGHSPSEVAPLVLRARRRALRAGGGFTPRRDEPETRVAMASSSTEPISTSTPASPLAPTGG